MLLTLNKLLNNGNFIEENRGENSYDLQTLSFFLMHHRLPASFSN